jgi:hypothetical protein
LFEVGNGFGTLENGPYLFEFLHSFGTSSHTVYANRLHQHGLLFLNAEHFDLKPSRESDTRYLLKPDNRSAARTVLHRFTARHGRSLGRPISEVVAFSEQTKPVGVARTSVSPLAGVLSTWRSLHRRPKLSARSRQPP